jgi:hypothetical protein
VVWAVWREWTAHLQDEVQDEELIAVENNNHTEMD